MKIWLPYTSSGSGADTLTRSLAAALADAGHEAVLQEFSHRFQYAPWLLRNVKPPVDTQAVITNSWNGFAFHQRGLKNITVEHLFVLDKALQPYKSAAQSIFHKQLVRRFVGQSYRSADHVVSVSRYTADRLRAVFPDVHTEVVLNGIDTEFFTPGNEAAEQEGADKSFRLLFVGNPTRRKGADLLPEIMQALGAHYELRYTSGRLGQPNLPMASNIRPLGRLSAEEVREQYRQCDALILPTRLEGLPLVAMEALSCGLPVISSNSASLAEVVDHELTGLVCPVDNVGAMVRGIRQLKENPDKLMAMKCRAREAAKARFCLRRMTAEYVELLHSDRSAGRLG